MSVENKNGVETSYTAMDIANWFLDFNFQLREYEDEDTDNISNLKLQKLLYYAEGCFLAMRNKSLFSDPIVAWKHGPVVESVYYHFKSNGSNGILEYEETNIDQETEDLLEEVYDVFGKYSAWGLRELTHKETPWLETEQSCEISREKIRDYFREHYVA